MANRRVQNDALINDFRRETPMRKRLLAESFEIFDSSDLQAQRNRSIAGEGEGDYLFLRQSRVLQSLLNKDNEVGFRHLINEAT